MRIDSPLTGRRPSGWPNDSIAAVHPRSVAYARLAGGCLRRRGTQLRPVGMAALFREEAISTNLSDPNTIKKTVSE
jgi:hypothetical protein